MTVCGARTDSPGFFTSCADALGRRSCPCGEQVAAELANPAPDPTTGDPA